jgi:hypothetical protein
MYTPAKYLRPSVFSKLGSKSIWKIMFFLSLLFTRSTSLSSILLVTLRKRGIFKSYFGYSSYAAILENARSGCLYVAPKVYFLLMAFATFCPILALSMFIDFDIRCCEDYFFACKFPSAITGGSTGKLLLPSNNEPCLNLKPLGVIMEPAFFLKSGEGGHVCELPSALVDC